MISSVGAENNGRDAKGKFAAGNKAGLGNPVHRRVAALRKEILRYANLGRHRAIVEKLYSMALGGDLDAIKEWLNRTVGKSIQAVEFVDMANDVRDNAMTKSQLEELIRNRAKVLSSNN